MRRSGRRRARVAPPGPRARSPSTPAPPRAGGGSLRGPRRQRAAGSSSCSPRASSLRERSSPRCRGVRRSRSPRSRSTSECCELRAWSACAPRARGGSTPSTRPVSPPHRPGSPSLGDPLAPFAQPLDALETEVARGRRERRAALTGDRARPPQRLTADRVDQIRAGLHRRPRGLAEARARRDRRRALVDLGQRQLERLARRRHRDRGDQAGDEHVARPPGPSRPGRRRRSHAAAVGAKPPIAKPICVPIAIRTAAPGSGTSRRRATARCRSWRCRRRRTCRIAGERRSAGSSRARSRPRYANISAAEPIAPKMNTGLRPIAVGQHRPQRDRGQRDDVGRRSPPTASWCGPGRLVVDREGQRADGEDRADGEASAAERRRAGRRASGSRQQHGERDARHGLARPPRWNAGVSSSVRRISTPTTTTTALSQNGTRQPQVSSWSSGQRGDRQEDRGGEDQRRPGCR